MAQTICQCVLAVLIIASILMSLTEAVNGSDAKPPSGVRGVFRTLLVGLFYFGVLSSAGAFSTII